MRAAVITRLSTADVGTFGSLMTDSGFHCRTGELPWRENQAGISCIPPGIYTCIYKYSPKHGMCYHVENVPGRTDIEIHAANFVGDITKGFKCQLMGCIAPGFAVAMLNGQQAVISSQSALWKLEEDLGRESFELTIVGL